VRDPQAEHLGIVVPIAGAHTATRSVRPAVRFDGTRADSVRAAPLLDEHGEAIRAALTAGGAWPGVEGSAASVAEGMR
jgi:crotonobetainyl-CoA:carnitine CoA-transferase CaiB-like acyl-CoA transferase